MQQTVDREWRKSSFQARHEKSEATKDEMKKKKPKQGSDESAEGERGCRGVAHEKKKKDNRNGNNLHVRSTYLPKPRFLLHIQVVLLLFNCHFQSVSRSYPFLYQELGI